MNNEKTNAKLVFNINVDKIVDGIEATKFVSKFSKHLACKGIDLNEIMKKIEVK